MGADGDAQNALLCSILSTFSSSVYRCRKGLKVLIGKALLKSGTNPLRLMKQFDHE